MADPILSNVTDLQALSSVLVGYQGQLGQMSLALLGGTAALLYANRKNRNCMPMIFSIFGGLSSGGAALAGLVFFEAHVNDVLKKIQIDPGLTVVVRVELFLIVLSAILLSIAAVTSEHE